MEPATVTKLMAAVCLLCLAGVRADDCAPYVRPDFKLQQGQTCVLSFCSGTCTNRYCSIIPGTALDQTQFMCLLNNLYVVIGIGITLFVLIAGSIVCCCCRSIFSCCCGHSSQHII
ncbi:uncharacterized protein PAF06_002431 [Gastrophryne carolinensis]